ncbi:MULTISPECIES: DUF4112 domain-containing protein [unclassified Leptolyngbya]|jgi:hypothetical protein|uniref:DUF4112 domain-containing protein n=1 Tax=unclassified Leptolyngbya TaxID=2650499 RepID=UPI0016843E79|nr:MULTISPECIES: DUF4112 domain-containing protein [unclassified Leptolyngbya]MBD1910619.1 DUF4112 domain-containing protein [Leptolyngbya sp. FACHB-8]MBD2154559.1 DUF4112 domain-containing protein [Leptolyngbya sp. FACHB-16]
MSDNHDLREAKSASTLQRVRTISHLLDNALPVPGTRYRVGLDPFLGLIPGGGDTIGAVLSAYIVLEALQLRLPRETLIRMVTNLLTDSVLGVIPFVGDLFDFGWKANSRNVALLEKHLANPTGARPADRWFIILMTLVVIGIVVGFAILVGLVFKFLLGLLLTPSVG